MRLLLIIISFTLFSYAQSQVKVKGQLTGKHAAALNDAKDAQQIAEEKEEKARKLQKQIKARELYRNRYDSIKRERLKALSSDSTTQDISMPTVADSTFTAQDSLEIATLILDNSSFPPEYRELLLNPIERDELTPVASDSLALARAQAILEEEAEKFFPGDMNAQKNVLSSVKNPAEGVGAFQQLSRPNPNLVKPEEARNLFQKVDPEQFKETQMDMQKLKRKYSELPDTRYPDEGKRRNSLEEIPFSKRLYFGGNISFQSTDPLVLSTNLQVGYWINKKWLAGIGFIMREQFAAEDSASSIIGDGYGYSLFTRYDIPKGFFAWVETEWQIEHSLFGEQTTKNAEWQRSYLLGIGREFMLGFVQMMSIIMYDFNYRSNSMNSSPWVFRVGFRVSKMPTE